MSLAERRDARRLAMAAGAALLVHVALFVAVPFLASLDAAPLPDYGPMVIRIELPEAVLEPPPPAPRPVPAQVPRPSTRTAPAPAARPATAPTMAATAPAAPVAPARSPGTSAFRQAGAATGTSAGPADPTSSTTPPPVDLPPTSGGSFQRSGEAVSLTSRSPGGTIDLGKVDKTLASAATSGTAAGTPGAAPAAGSGTPAASADASIVWEDPAAAEGREYRIEPKVVLPSSAPDFLNEVRISFAVNADGLVTSARVARTSGSVDVDNACLEAMRKAKFTSSRGAPEIRGTQVFAFVQKR